jgi:hypothetical protein
MSHFRGLYSVASGYRWCMHDWTLDFRLRLQGGPDRFLFYSILFFSFSFS